MRIHLLLTTLATLLAFLAGTLLFSGWGSPIAPVTPSGVRALFVDFAKTHRPIATTDIISLFPPAGATELTHPQNAMNRSHLFPYEAARALHEFAKTCREHPSRSGVEGGELAKAWIWERYRCGLTRELPKDFIGTAPYTHPFGSSYALLYARLARNEKEWSKSHLAYFHVKEYAGLAAQGVALSRARTMLSGFSDDELAALLLNYDSLLTMGFLLLRHHPDPNGDVEALSPSLYRVYGVSAWREFLESRIEGWNARQRRGDEKCAVLTDNICWENAPHTFADFLNRYVIVLFAGSLVLAGSILAALFVKMRQDKKEEERRVFGLRTLTHELRTPVASLVLHIETLKDEFDALSEDGQDAYMRLNSDASRLRRLVEASRHYLKAAAGGAMISFSARRVDSVNEQVQCLLSEYGPEVRFHALASDASLTLDCYWLGVCVKNLVENALQHGKPPVDVHLLRESGEFRITVEDRGFAESAGFKDMTTPFCKGEKSSGYGLGLSLVARIAKEMGGRLHFAANPTRFTIILKDNS
jgi:signal transduction histidine kinase